VVDLTVAAIPFFFGTMGAEAWHQRRRLERTGVRTAGDYERNDTITSLTMGTISLVMPFVANPFMRRFDVMNGRYRKVALSVAGSAAVAAVVADAVARSKALAAGELPDPPVRTSATSGHIAAPGSTAHDPGAADNSTEPTPGSTSGATVGSIATEANASRLGRGTTGPRSRAMRRARSGWQRIGGAAALTAIAATGAVAAGTWAGRTTGKRLYAKRIVPDLGTGVGATVAATAAWDFIYYWNHRFMHSSRYLWALHVVHHSSEHYNLSTALRQSVGDALGLFVPYGAMGLVGFRPEMIERARGINLIYQYWVHTDTIAKLGPAEKVLNTASHHRVHHGSNRRYLDRNHGSILIIWDRMFGTFQEEDDDEPVVYGLTKNINTFNPLKVATHELVHIGRDVAGSDTWADRLSFVLRGPGWAYERHRELGTVSAHRAEEAAALAG